MEPKQVIWQGNKAVTLKHIARAVGVSESLASHVLNGSRSGTRVSATTREAVVKAAEEMGYRPNAQAKSLNTGRSNRLGMYSGRATLDARNSFFAELLGGMFEGASAFGMNTVVHTSGQGFDKLLELVSDRAVDGLVVFAGGNDPIIDLLGELRVPAVAIADRIEGLPSICADDKAGGAMQADHLAELGHRHVLYLLPETPPNSATGRFEAFEERADALGIRVTMRSKDRLEALDINDACLRALTQQKDRATAVVAWNDSAAEGIWRTLSEHGIAVPDEVSVIGFDGFLWPTMRFDQLTTIRAPWAEVGRVAVLTLADMLQGLPVPMLRQLPVEFVRGTTSSAFRGLVGVADDPMHFTGGKPNS